MEKQFVHRIILIILATLLLVVALYQLTFAAESIVEGTPHDPGCGLWYVDIVCTADSDSSFDTQITSGQYCGYLYALSTIPGSIPPTANADLDIYHTVDGAVTSSEMLGAQGDDVIQRTSKKFVMLSNKIAVCGPLGIDMENSFAANASFTLRLYFRIPGAD